MAESTLWGSNGLDSEDVIDTLNPLHHIPSVGAIYRAVIDDDIAIAPRMIGGGIYGGPFGLASAALDGLLKHVSGKDIGEHVTDLVKGITGTTERNPATDFIDRLDSAKIDKALAKAHFTETKIDESQAVPG